MKNQDSNHLSKNPTRTFKSLDKRYIPRWEVTNRILYSYDNDNQCQEGLSKDISCLGACLNTQENIPIDKKIKLKIYLSEKKSFDVEAKIKWKKATSDGYSVGVIFENVPQEIQELILTHAFELKREDVVRHWFSGWEGRKV